MKIKFVGGWVLLHQQDNLVAQQKQVLVQDDKIVRIDTQIDEPADRVIDLKGNILMSGFVNAHAHNVMTLLRSFKSDVILQDWLFDHIFPAEEKLTAQDAYWGEMLGIAESVRAGITCFEENYFFVPSVFKAIKKSGIRARIGIGKEKGDQPLLQDLQSSYELIKNQPLIKAVVYPHAIYSVSEQDMETYVSFARQNSLPMATHLSETLTEVSNCIAEKQKTPPQYLEDMGFFDRQTTLYHCVHMDKEDVQILKQYGAHVVTCPSSNLKLASGFAPINTFVHHGVPVAIGTDGPASNDTIDMFKEMFLVATLQKAMLSEPQILPAEQVLNMATVNGAKALGWNNVGKIEQGYQADLIVVNTKGLHFTPLYNKISALVYCAKSTDVLLTMVNGKILYENGKFNIGEKIEDIITNCNMIAKKLAN